MPACGAKRRRPLRLGVDLLAAFRRLQHRLSRLRERFLGGQTAEPRPPSWSRFCGFAWCASRSNAVATIPARAWYAQPAIREAPTANLLSEGLVLDAFLSPEAKLTYGRASLWKTDG